MGKMKKEIAMMKREIERLRNEKEDKKKIVVEGFVRKGKVDRVLVMDYE